MAEDALVKNAADPDQVRAAAKKERLTKHDATEDLRFVLSTIQGRRVLWRIMSHCRVFQSVYAEGNRIYFNAGQQDAGQFVMGMIVEANEDALLQMMKESKEKKYG